MRNYLQLTEIESILDNYISNDDTHDEIMAAVRNEAETCLCAALCSNECCCGAWEESDDIDWDDLYLDGGDLDEDERFF